VILECTEVHQIRDLERCKSFDQLLDKLRVAKQFLVTGVVVIRCHALSYLDA
jgi:hypothetical protein